MSVITDQKPSGGCVNCGAAVRTRKRDMWVCWRCVELVNRDPDWYEIARQLAAKVKEL